MYDIKALYEAKSVKDAVRLLVEHPEALVIAGGSDVLIKIREGKLAGRELVSIYGIDEMRGVSYEADGSIRIRIFCRLIQRIFFLSAVVLLTDWIKLLSVV